MPRVIRKNRALLLIIAAGADANHDPRTFTLPISQRHLEVIESDLKRHFLLWSALLPLCEAAGSEGLLDEIAATSLLDPILLGTVAEVETFFKQIAWDRRQLIAHHANNDMFEDGNIFAALESATLDADWNLVWKYDAKRNRARREVTLSPLDEALLKYTDRHLHGGKVPIRKPEAVDPELLPKVLDIVATAEGASAGMKLRPNWGKGEYNPDDKKEWNKIQDEVEVALRIAYPTLTQDAIKTVSFLMCSEAAKRSKVRKES